jgi:WD40 repeat protein
MLAAGYHNGTIRAWKLPQDERILRTPAAASAWFERFIGQEEGHQEVISAVAVSADGKIVASASGDGSVGLWERASGKPIRRWKGHDGRADGVTFSPDGKLLATSGIDDRVCLWEVPAGKLLRRLPGNQVAFSPDGRLLACSCPAEGVPWGAGSRDIVLHETATGKERVRLRRHPGSVLCLAFSPDGRTLASGAAAQRTDGPNVDQAPRVIHTIRLWDLARERERLRFGGDRYSVYSLAFSPDGRTLASGMWTSGSFKEGDKPDAPVPLWETATGKERGRLEGHSGYVSSVAFSADGRLLAAGGMDRTVRVWAVGTEKQVARLVGHRAAVTGVAFIPAGRAVVSGSWDTTALIWTLPPG